MLRKEPSGSAEAPTHAGEQLGGGRASIGAGAGASSPLGGRDRGELERTALESGQLDAGLELWCGGPIECLAGDAMAVDGRLVTVRQGDAEQRPQQQGN